MSIKYKIELSIKAKNDLKNIILYINNDLKEFSIAQKYILIFKKTIKKLEYFPQKFAIIDDILLKEFKIRKIQIKNFIIFYTISDEKPIVTITRILYAKSNWINLI